MKKIPICCEALDDFEKKQQWQQKNNMQKLGRRSAPNPTGVDESGKGLDSGHHEGGGGGEEEKDDLLNDEVPPILYVYLSIHMPMCFILFTY